MKRSAFILALGLVLGSTLVVWTQDGRSPIANLRGRTTETGELMVNVGTADANIINVPTVTVSNLVPTSSPSYAVSPCGIFTTASTNATVCADAAANLYGVVYAINTTATPAFIRFINTASSPTCTDSILIPPIPIPAYSAAGVYSGVHLPMINPVNFTNGIGVCVTGGADGTGNATAGISVLIGVKE